MSVQQVKDRFQELTAYLGRDVTGIDKLRKLKDAVNVVRTSLASAQEQLADCAATRKLAVDRAVAAESELANVRLETHSLQQKLENLRRDLNAATKREPTGDDLENSTSDAASLDQAVMTQVIKKLRKRSRYCPPQAANVRGIPAYNREALSEGWSHEALWELGASVALLAGFYGEVVIQTEVTLRDKEFDENREGFNRNLIQWYSKHNMEDSTKFDRRAGFVRVRNVQDGLGKQVQNQMAEQAVRAMESRGFQHING